MMIPKILHFAQGLPRSRFFKNNYRFLLPLFLVLFILPSLVAQELYWTEYTRVRKSDSDGSSTQTLINNPDNFQGLALDLDNDKIYFLNVQDASLERSDMDGSNIEHIFTFPGSVPHGFRHLALDPANEMAYIADAANHEISRVKYDGSGYEILVDDCRTAHGVTLDLDAGRVYFSCPNSGAKYIGVSDLDGANRDTIITNVKATGMSLDVANDRLYYFDQNNGSVTYDIMRVNFDGTGNTLIYDSPTFAMTLRYDPEDDELWLSRSGDRKILKMNSDGTNAQIIIHGLSTTYDLSIDLLHAPLPVKLTYFSAQVFESRQVKLDWETASEDENMGFEIQQSKNGEDWRNIGFVEGHGNSTQLIQYSFIDQSPYPGENYYRLKQIDYDGKYEFSEIRQVTFQANMEELLKVFPNPTTDRFTVAVFNAQQKRARVKVYASTGQVIWERSFKEGEMNTYWAKTFDLPQEELYFISTQVGDKIETRKVSVIAKY